MKAEQRWLTNDEQDLWRLMLQAARKIDRVMEDTLLCSAQLSSSEFAVLAALSEVDEECLRLRDLCSVLDWDRSRTSHQITRMERRELVTKEKSPGDARGVLVCLTETGRESLLRAVPDHVESVRRIVFDHLNTDDAPVLERFFRGVMNVENVPGGKKQVPGELHLTSG
nr:MarR family transcriptional regulator [Streptococcus thermophilus]